MSNEKVVVIDFGAQYAHLITRRVRECGVYSELISHNVSAEKIKDISPKGLILSGGPSSVYSENAPIMDKSIFDLNIPILGICYGLQLMVHMLGGDVLNASKKEYGRADLHISNNDSLFKGLNKSIVAWMSHGDTPTKIPDGFETIAHTDNSTFAAIQNSNRKLFGVQFHPEVNHTPNGTDILNNFLYQICSCSKSWTMDSFITTQTERIKNQVGSDKVLCAISGGVDSTTAAALIHKAIGDNLVGVFVNHGLLRKGEHDDVVKILEKLLGSGFIYVNSSERFISKLDGISDPEQKRKIIGEEFIYVFQEQSNKYGPFKWLAQGTLYPDVIESAGSGSPASKIKSHHNVAALPPDMKFQLIEPLRDLYKDEVRKLASLLGITEDLFSRHPFPGPGLSVRIMGAITREKIRICRESSFIVEEELKKSNNYSDVWQAFAIVGDDEAVGVLGDERAFGHVVTIRVVSSVDAMPADWVRLAYDVLENMSNRITNEVPGVTWVTYAISSKPPSTIEPH